MNEEWRPVVGWEQFYEVSSFGRVWSKPGTKLNRWGTEVPKPGRILVQSPASNNRPAVSLCAWGRRTSAHVHILVAEAFLGPRPDGMHCCHKDGDQTNNYASNLRWDTVSSNIDDEVAHGTHRNSTKTHCPYGHPLVDPNLVHNKSTRGRRMSQCKVCVNARSTISYRYGTARGSRDRPEFQELGDMHCDRLMPGWRDWTPPEGFQRPA